MTKEKYLEIARQKSPTQLKALLNKMSYDQLDEIWREITNGEGNIDLSEVKRGYKGKIKEALKPFYRMDIYRITMGILENEKRDGE